MKMSLSSSYTIPPIRGAPIAINYVLVVWIWRIPKPPKSITTITRCEAWVADLLESNVTMGCWISKPWSLSPCDFFVNTRWSYCFTVPFKLEFIFSISNIIAWGQVSNGQVSPVRHPIPPTFLLRSVVTTMKSKQFISGSRTQQVISPTQQVTLSGLYIIIGNSSPDRLTAMAMAPSLMMNSLKIMS